jgi:quercetin dioxygenase-like cupin family protein
MGVASRDEMAITRKGAAKDMDRAPGVIVRILTDGEKAMLVEVDLEPGSVVPMHTHTHEQTGTLISGRMRFEIGEEAFELEPGDAWMIPGGVAHEAAGIDRCRVVEVFTAAGGLAIAGAVGPLVLREPQDERLVGIASAFVLLNIGA